MSHINLRHGLHLIEQITCMIVQEFHRLIVTTSPTKTHKHDHLKIVMQ